MTRTLRARARNLAAPGPKALEALGRALEAHYADLVSAPLPEKLTKLMARLETEDRIPDPQGSDDDAIR